MSGYVQPAVVNPIVTERLFVAYDAGESNAFIPIFNRLIEEGKDFKVLVMGTAATIIKPGMFEGKRIDLKDLQITENVDKDNWKREQRLSRESREKIRTLINAKTIIVGTASRVQRQFLKHVQAYKIAFCDNFDYDKTHEVFKTVDKVQKAAQKVLCPSSNLMLYFVQNNPGFPEKYEVVGKPTLEDWKRNIQKVDTGEVCKKLGFDQEKEVIMFIGGYGQGYEVINPLYDTAVKQLSEAGYQVLLQPHPKVAPQKVTTPEALAIADYVVGYNSSVIFDAGLIGKHAIYFFPPTVAYDHFAIKDKLLSKVESCEALLQDLGTKDNPPNLFEKANIPVNSTEKIIQIIDRALNKDK